MKQLFKNEGLTAYRAATYSEAKELLNKMGVKWDRAIKRDGGVIFYFMQGHADIAYFTNVLDSLVIHNAPRPWGDSEACYDIFENNSELTC